MGGGILLLFPLLGNVEVYQFALLPIFCPLFAVGLDQFSFAVADVVVVGAGEDVAGSERVNAVALLDAVHPLALVTAYNIEI